MKKQARIELLKNREERTNESVFKQIFRFLHLMHWSTVCPEWRKSAKGRQPMGGGREMINWIKFRFFSLNGAGERKRLFDAILLWFVFHSFFISLWCLLLSWKWSLSKVGFILSLYILHGGWESGCVGLSERVTVCNWLLFELIYKNKTQRVRVRTCKMFPKEEEKKISL